MAKKPTFRERALFLVNPEKGNAQYAKRLREEMGGAAAAKMSYGKHGASSTLNSMIGWLVGGGNAEDDIDLYSSTLRKRSRDLYAGGGLARSGPNTLMTSVVGWGIQPKPKIDGDFLGMTEEQVEEAERAILREWKLWAENPMCDAARQETFYGLQNLAFLSELMSGDVLALLGMEENARTPYQTTVRLIEADRLSTPGSNGDSESTTTDDGGRIIDGVEIDKNGAVRRYHIASRNPEAENDYSTLEWTAIDAFGKNTGLPVVLHMMTAERPEQRRGVPFVASEIEQLKQLDRYLKSELAANVVSSMLTAFITTEEDDGRSGIEDSIDPEEKVTDDDFKIEMAPGAIYTLDPGKHIESINPIRNNSAFQNFVDAYEILMGAGMGVPKEVLVKKYDSNYTASRAALLDFWRTVRVYRTRFNRQFNQPVYEAWLAEAVSIGRIEAPGFFEDPAIRQAWCGCLWMGTSMGHVDPLKEVKAAAARIENNISTQEQEAAEYNGNDWNSNVRQRRREIEGAAELQKMINELMEQSGQSKEAGDE